MADPINPFKTHIFLLEEKLSLFKASLMYSAPEGAETKFGVLFSALEILKKMELNEQISQDELKILLKIPAFKDDPNVKNYPKIIAPAESASNKL
jgi:hypothetical protein